MGKLQFLQETTAQYGLCTAHPPETVTSDRPTERLLFILNRLSLNQSYCPWHNVNRSTLK